MDPMGYRNCSHQSPSPFFVHFFAAKDLDAAVLSRVPLHIEFGRPEAELLQKQVSDRAERLPEKAAGERLCQLLKQKGKEDLAAESVGDALYKWNFTGRDVQGLFEEIWRLGD
eukprot:symbB.v1.2.010810.t1/scaffold712.1/size170421/9